MKTNVDQKLLTLASEHKSRWGSLKKGDKARRAFIRGQAEKLIAKAYPINREIIWQEWRKLSLPECKAVLLYR